MITYIPQNSTRDQFLLSLSIQNHKKSSVGYFFEDDIYEICLSKKADIVILNEHNVMNRHISNFISDIEHSRSSSKTKIIILISDEHKKYQNSNIVCIPKKSYLCFNEFYKHNTNVSYKYILCHLDNKNIGNNSIIESILYPNNTTIAVKVVNSPMLNHPQNLGIVSEQDMLDLIHDCYAYVCVSDDYLYDAIRMDKKVLCGSSNNIISKWTEEVSVENIERLPNASNLCDISSINRYSLSNIAKHIIKT